MKKLLALCILVCLALSLCACGGTAAPAGSGAAAVPDGGGSNGGADSASAPDASAADALTWVTEPSLAVDDIVCIIDDCPANHDGKASDYYGLAFYTKGGSRGVVNADGKLVVPEYTNATWCSLCGIVDYGTHLAYMPNGAAAAGPLGHGGADMYLIYAENENRVLAMSYGMVTDTFAYMAQESTYNYFCLPVVKLTGNYVVVDDSTPYEDMMGADSASTEFTGQYIIADKQGNVVGNARYTDLRGSCEVCSMLEAQDYLQKSTGVNDYFCVQNTDGTWSYLRPNGQVLFGGYRDAQPFHEGYAAVQNSDGLWGYIDTAGQTVIPFILEDASGVFDGCAWAKQNGKWGRLQVGETKGLPCYRDYQ